MTIFYTIGFGYVERDWRGRHLRTLLTGETDVAAYTYAHDVMDYPSDSLRTICFWLGTEGEEG